MTILDMDGGKKRRKRKILKVKIKRDNKGRYVIVKGRKYRISKNVRKERVGMFVKSKLFPKDNVEIKPIVEGKIKEIEPTYEGIAGELKNLSIEALKDVAKQLDIPTTSLTNKRDIVERVSKETEKYPNIPFRKIREKKLKEVETKKKALEEEERKHQEAIDAAEAYLRGENERVNEARKKGYVVNRKRVSEHKKIIEKAKRNRWIARNELRLLSEEERIIKAVLPKSISKDEVDEEAYVDKKGYIKKGKDEATSSSIELEKAKELAKKAEEKRLAEEKAKKDEEKAKKDEEERLAREEEKKRLAEQKAKELLTSSVQIRRAKKEKEALKKKRDEERARIAEAERLAKEEEKRLDRERKKEALKQAKIQEKRKANARKKAEYQESNRPAYQTYRQKIDPITTEIDRLNTLIATHGAKKKDIEESIIRLQTDRTLTNEQREGLIKTANNQIAKIDRDVTQIKQTLSGVKKRGTIIQSEYEKVKKKEPEYEKEEIDEAELERDIAANEKAEEERVKHVQKVMDEASSSNSETEKEMVKRAEQGAAEIIKEGQAKYGLGEKGISNIKIDSIMRRYPEYLGTISADEIGTKIIPKITGLMKGGFIINTDTSKGPGEHWQAVYFDGRKGGESEINFFDSYADKPTKTLLKGMKLIVDKLNSHGLETLLKFKTNRIRYQNDKSSNCGYFCMDFLEKRFNGHPFREATVFNNVVNGERAIERYKVKHGGYRYIVGNGPLDFYKIYPPSVRKYLDSKEEITSLDVERTPIKKILDRIINIVSLGSWDRAKRDYGVADVFHLYFLINGKYRLERNHVVSMGPYKGREKDSQSVRVSLRGKRLTIGEFLKNIGDRVGAELQRYDPSSNNCQVFIKQGLEANGLAGGDNAGVLNFALQPIDKMLDQTPGFLKPIMKGVTDIAHLGDKLISGNGREGISKNYRGEVFI